MQHWDEYTVFQEVNFDWCPFWIQFHGLPHVAFDHENAITLGNAMGKVVMYEAPKLQDKLSRTFIRVRTSVNIRDPLVAGFWVPRPQRDPIWVTIKYEQLRIIVMTVEGLAMRLGIAKTSMEIAKKQRWKTALAMDVEHLM